MEFVPVRYDEAAYQDYVQLFSLCFPQARKYHRDYLDWLYRANPDGRAVGYDARDGDRLAAHYVCIPARAWVGGQEVDVLLSLNTATHPAYQGRGLFTQLAERTYAAGAAAGYDAVYGVANANSTPGFTRKLKFQLLSPLRAMLGLGALGIDFTASPALQFRRSWSVDALAWRCSSPVNPVMRRTGDGHSHFLAAALFSQLCLATAELEDGRPDPALLNTKAVSRLSPLRLFLGLVPPPMQRWSLYVDIPQVFRPSPLNLIYRSLSGRVQSIDPESVFLNFLDFDAY